MESGRLIRASTISFILLISHRAVSTERVWNPGSLHSGGDSFSHIETKIVGGDEAAIEKFPFVGSLHRHGVHYCGVSLLMSMRHVLTAGHCVDGVEAKDLTVFLGSANRENGQVFNVKKVATHPKYYSYNESVHDYDVSVLLLDKLVLPNRQRKPINLPFQDTTFSDGTICTVAGWGMESENDTTFPTQLRSVNVPIYNFAKCQKAYGELLTDRMICAGYEEGGKDSCLHDSGGPLICKGVHAGIVSWGRGCAQPGFAGIYTNTALFTNWILKQMFTLV